MMQEDSVWTLRPEKLAKLPEDRHWVLGSQTEPVADVLPPQILPRAAQHDGAMGERWQIAAREEDRIAIARSRLERPIEVVGRDLCASDTEVGMRVRDDH